MENEDVENEITSVLFEESQVISNHLLEENNSENINSFECIVDQNVASDNEQENYFEDAFIVDSLQLISDEDTFSCNCDDG